MQKVDFQALPRYAAALAALLFVAGANAQTEPAAAQRTVVWATLTIGVDGRPSKVEFPVDQGLSPALKAALGPRLAVAELDPLLVDGVPTEGTTPAKIVLEAHGEGDNATVRIADVQLEPRLLHKVRPYYPRRALERGVGGDVVLRCEVGEDGHCGEIEVVEAPPMRDLRISATESLRRWRFEPQRIGGAATGTVVVPFSFKLGRITNPDWVHDTQRMEALQRAAAFRLRRRLGEP